MKHTKIRPATLSDVPDLLRFIHLLAEYEKLEHEVTATHELLTESLFGETANAEAIFLEEDGVNVAMAIFFHNYSTFVGKRGLYLEDLFVLPEHRSKGYGERMLRYLAKLALERNCGRFEWSVLNWNEPAIRFYKNQGAVPQSDWIIQRVSGEALTSLAAKSVDILT